MDREYVQIESEETVDQDMTGWMLEDSVGHTYYFPNDFILPIKGTVRVWTKSGADDNDDLFWARTSAVWGNESDTAYLRDEMGTVVDSYSWTADAQ